jgi:hypothetical protein
MRVESALKYKGLVINRTICGGKKGVMTTVTGTVSREQPWYTPGKVFILKNYTMNKYKIQGNLS